MADELLRFEVAGKPEPKGAMTALVPTHPKTKKPYRREGGGIVVNVKPSNEATLKVWDARVKAAAEDAWGERLPLEGVSLMVEADFFLYRAQDQWGSGRNATRLKESASASPIKYPDVDKLLRAVLDALTGIVYKDDAMVTLAIAEKHYAVPDEAGDGEGVRLVISRRDLQSALDLPDEQRTRFVPGVAAQTALI